MVLKALNHFSYDSVAIYHQEGNQKGCLITHTYNEFAGNEDQVINDQMGGFMNGSKDLIIEKLEMANTKDKDIIIKKKSEFHVTR